MKRYVCLDTETTGLDKHHDRIVEVGAVEILDTPDFGRKLGAELQLYVCPPIRVTPGAVAVHGLTDAFLADKPGYAEAWPEIDAFLAGADEIIIHNADFDVAFLEREAAANGLPSFRAGRRITDTLRMARNRQNRKRKNDLDSLASEYGVRGRGGEAHGALRDARVLANVWMAMTRGQATIAFEAKAVTAPTSRPHIPVIIPSPAEISAHEALCRRLGIEVF